MLKSFTVLKKNQYYIHTNVGLHKILTVVTLVVLHKDLKAILVVWKILIVFSLSWKSNERTTKKQNYIVIL